MNAAGFSSNVPQNDKAKSFVNAKCLALIGRERIRLNRMTGGMMNSQVVSSSGLQNKANRDYWIESRNLQTGEVYVSDLDLNRENGALSLPYQPVLRFITPGVLFARIVGLLRFYFHYVLFVNL
jgi:hypothetical protein